MKPLWKVGSDKKRIYFFMISHIFGWLVAWIQTVWIIYEIKKIRKNWG